MSREHICGGQESLRARILASLYRQEGRSDICCRIWIDVCVYPALSSSIALENSSCAVFFISTFVFVLSVIKSNVFLSSSAAPSATASASCNILLFLVSALYLWSIINQHCIQRQTIRQNIVSTQSHPQLTECCCRAVTVYPPTSALASGPSFLHSLKMYSSSCPLQSLFPALQFHS